MNTAGEIVVPIRSDFSRIAANNPILRNARSRLRDECPFCIQKRATFGGGGKTGFPLRYSVFLFDQLVIAITDSLSVAP
jgi:hypothetical protein